MGPARRMGGKDIMTTRTTSARTAGTRTDGARTAGTRKPPVTQQPDWDTVLRPWIRSVEEALEIEDLCDVDRVHEMTGVVASGVQRSMAPISSFLVGIAVGRGASLEDACRVVERVTVERADAEPGDR